MTELSFDALPAALPAYGRLVLSRPRSPVVLAESLVARAHGVRIANSALAGYRRVCALGDGQGVPVCYPQVLAYPLHLRLLGEPAFPLAAMGLVHLSNRIEQARGLDPAERFDIEVRIDAIRDEERGYEFDLVTRVLDEQGDCPWLGAATILSRKSGAGGGSRKSREATPCGLPLLEEWRVGANMGRRYARVSGDFNPIHLTALSARLLGFRRAIVHGMWTLARATAALPADSAGACVLDARFKTPLFLPGKARLHGAAEAEGYLFEVRNAGDDRPILSGSLS